MMNAGPVVRIMNLMCVKRGTPDIDECQERCRREELAGMFFLQFRYSEKLFSSGLTFGLVKYMDFPCIIVNFED